jgi:hypothetical protein
MDSARPTHLCQGWGVQGACPDRTPVQGLRRPAPHPTRCRRRREQSRSMLVCGDLLHGVNTKHRAGCDADKQAGSMGASTIPSPTPPPPIIPSRQQWGCDHKGEFCVECHAPSPGPAEPGASPGPAGPGPPAPPPLAACTKEARGVTVAVREDTWARRRASSSILHGTATTHITQGGGVASTLRAWGYHLRVSTPNVRNQAGVCSLLSAKNTAGQPGAGQASHCPHSPAHAVCALLLIETNSAARARAGRCQGRTHIALTRLLSTEDPGAWSGPPAPAPGPAADAASWARRRAFSSRRASSSPDSLRHGPRGCHTRAHTHAQRAPSRWSYNRARRNAITAWGCQAVSPTWDPRLPSPPTHPSAHRAAENLAQRGPTGLPASP